MDGNRYLDCNDNFTSIIIGHADEGISAAAAERMARGSAVSHGNDCQGRLAKVTGVPGIRGSDGLDGATGSGCSGESRVGGDERCVEEFGERDIGGVVDRQI